MAWGSTTDYFTSNGRDFKYVANMWYNEVEYYDFAQPVRGACTGRRCDLTEDGCPAGTSINAAEAIGHFTQVVWKGSTKLGCGSASCANGQIVVCQYDPTGNFIGQYSANVDEPTKTATECSAAGTVKVPCAADNTCAEKSAPAPATENATPAEEQAPS
eukprot:303698-Rhodomonas_salina.1